jgi:hypothetical protein
VNQSIVDRALFLDEGEDRQGRLSLETARLSAPFYEQLQRHPIPLEEGAIKALSNNSAALDCYVWLAYRLHSLERPRLVTWAALKAQHGQGFAKLYHFKSKFPAILSMATAVYPDADVEVTEEGLILKPSRPPVKPRLASARKEGSHQSPHMRVTDAVIRRPPSVLLAAASRANQLADKLVEASVTG